MSRQLSPPADPAPPGVRQAKTLAAEWSRLDAERKEFARQASDLGRRQREIESQLKASVEAHAEGPEKTLLVGSSRDGYRLSIVYAPRAVAWKSEFIERLGEELAQKLIQQQPLRPKLEIERR